MTRWRYKSRRYGSVRIFPDGRVRFSPWTFEAAPSYLAIDVGGHIQVVRFGRYVMELDYPYGRVITANFLYDLSVDELRGTVADLRYVKHGLERWIVPALEFTCLASTFREQNPETYAAARELLESCHDLPVAKFWQRHRAAYYAKYRVPLPEVVYGKVTPARKSRRKASPPTRSKKSSPRTK